MSLRLLPQLLRVVGHPPRRGVWYGTFAAGVGEASGKETAGRFRLGGGIRWVYGDLTAGEWLEELGLFAGRRWFGGRLGCLSENLTTLPWWRGELLAGRCPAVGIGSSVGVAGGSGRRRWCLWNRCLSWATGGADWRGTGWTAWLECVDDDHGTAATGARLCEAGHVIRPCVGFGLVWWHR